jgi:putative molybdopterin biosynthesis protein
MGRRVATRPVESEVRVRRQAAGLSQQDLAEQAGLTRQAVSAIEGGKYIPNTVVALRLGRILGCRVEELFELPEGDEEREVQVVASDPAPPDAVAGPVRAVVGYARGRWVAHPLTARRALQEGFACADAVLPGVAAAGAGGEPGGTARAWLDIERLERTALLLGCDPALGIVAGHLSRPARGRDPARVTWLEAGSAASLEAIAGGTAHLAGLHLRDGETGEFNVPQARRALAVTGGVVVAFARWAQGFVVAPGNPKAVRTAADLAREDVRLINREPGAGSRALLDQMLLGAGVASGAVRGYERQVASHFQVAGTVAAGGADTGIALAAAAEAYGLDFVPLVEVRFDVAIPADHLDHPAVARFLEALQTRALREDLRALPGYDVDELGSVRAEVTAAA